MTPTQTIRKSIRVATHYDIYKQIQPFFNINDHYSRYSLFVENKTSRELREIIFIRMISIINNRCISCNINCE